jgi:hypothetical protein
VPIDWNDVAQSIEARDRAQRRSARRRWTHEQIERFESERRVKLPATLSALYVYVGEGHMLLPLDRERAIREHAVDWGRDADRAVASLVGRLDEPFPHGDAWNMDDVAPAIVAQIDIDDVERSDLARRYWAPFPGAFPFAQIVDVDDTLVVITGAMHGTVWRDARIRHAGLVPWRTADRAPMSIDRWAELFVEAERMDDTRFRASYPTTAR